MNDLDITDYESAEQLRGLADATDAAEAFARGEVTYTDEPVELLPPTEGESMVVSSIRLPVDLAWRAKKAAAARGIPTTALMRELIAAGLDLVEAGRQRDPVTELHAIADAANRAIRALETQQRHAA